MTASCHGQAVQFKTQSSMGIATLQRALNGLLPADIRIREAEEVDQDFMREGLYEQDLGVSHLEQKPSVRFSSGGMRGISVNRWTWER